MDVLWEGGSRYLTDCLALASPLCAAVPASWAGFLPFALLGELVNVGDRKFRVLQKLGEGGYATVYLVKEVPTPAQPNVEAEPLAVKKAYAHSGERLEAVQQEMRIHAALRHPNILPLLASSTAEALDGGGTPCHTCLFLFPAYRDGTLADVVDRLHKAGARLPTADVLHMFGQMCRAAQHIHQQGYAHRDLKPHNVLVRRPAGSAPPALPAAGGLLRNGSLGMPLRSMRSGDSSAGDVELGIGASGMGRQASDAYERSPLLMGGGGASGQGAGAGGPSVSGRGGSSGGYHVAVMDFGSARPRRVEVRHRGDALSLQEDAEAHCSAPYRAPELLDVPSPASLDFAAADVWALGASLFHTMYGEPPFQHAMDAAGGSLALAVLNCSIAWPKDPSLAYPQQLHDLVQACMQLDPAQRPNAMQLVEHVNALQQQQPNLPDPRRMASRIS